MAKNVPPEEVLVEFLRLLSQTIGFDDDDGPGRVAVLRGSLLLRHWYGSLARPAGDIDLEMFDQADAPAQTRRREQYDPYESLVDYGKAMCRYASQSSRRYRWRKGTPRPEIEFDRTEPPKDGSCLWTYGTPGQRYYIGWIRHGRNAGEGKLQIDIAQPGTYQFGDLGVTKIQLGNPGGDSFQFLAYTHEAMAAAKLSWLLRSLTREVYGDELSAPIWKGELKDLLDLHLLLTQSNLDAERFQRSLLAISGDDQLDWKNLATLFDARCADMTDDHFTNWNAFRRQYASIIANGPAAMLRTVAEKLAPLLGDFFRIEEMPFLTAMHSGPIDEVAYMSYSDWLQERGDERGEFVKQLTAYLFHRHPQTAEERARDGAAIHTALASQSQAWLHQVFGTARQWREFRGQMESEAQYVQSSETP